MHPRIGVYVCHCGSNIAGKVDVQAVTRYAAGLPDVVIARDYVFMCSEPGQEQIRKDIVQHRLDRVVVASCSPLMHEPTFRRACQKAGLNQYMLQIANIREQCSWSTDDGAAATEKAEALINGAIGKARHLRPLGVREVPVTQAVLIVGGGIAGIQAALQCAEAGKKVFLVERKQSIGGHMAMLDKTFPTLDCSACILTPKMVSAGQHSNITVYAYSEVEEVSGHVGSMKVKIRRKATCVDPEKCNGCGLCQEKCPYKASNEFEQGKNQRKAIYTLFPQAVPSKPVIDKAACRWFQGAAEAGGNGDGKKPKSRCGACAKLCPTKAIDFEQQDSFVEVEVGAVILTTGHQMFDAAAMTQYGYGRLPEVYTALEFERMVNSGGFTKGEIQTSDGHHPKAVGIVHCVGSRDQRFQPYCSSICCMYSLKFAHLVHEHSDAVIYNFYIDMRCVGKGYEEFYDRLLGEGVRFVRGKVAAIAKGEGGEAGSALVATVEDTMAGVVRRIPLDLVILANGLKAQEDANAVGRLFGVSRNRDGFFIEQHPKLNPVGTPNECVFIAGTCAGPKDIPHTVAQASAAAAGALTLLGRGKVVLESIAAHVQQEQCSGCRTCLEMCPYSAVGFDEEHHRAEIDDTSCRGCGTCVAACPAGALTQDHFTDAQIFAEIEGLLRWDEPQPPPQREATAPTRAGASAGGATASAAPPA